MSFHALAASGSPLTLRQGDAEIDLIDLKDTPAATPRCQPHAEETESVTESPATYANAAGAQDMHDCEWDKLCIQSPLKAQRARTSEAPRAASRSSSPSANTASTLPGDTGTRRAHRDRYSGQYIEQTHPTALSPRSPALQPGVRHSPDREYASEHSSRQRSGRRSAQDRPARILEEEVIKYTDYYGNRLTAMVCTYSDDSVVVHGDDGDKARIVYDPLEARAAADHAYRRFAYLEQNGQTRFRALDHYVPTNSIMHARTYYRNRFLPSSAKLAGRRVSSSRDCHRRLRSGQSLGTGSASTKRRAELRRRQKVREGARTRASDDAYQSRKSEKERKECVCGGIVNAGNDAAPVGDDPSPMDDAMSDSDHALEGHARKAHLYGVLVENLVHETKTADVELAFSDCGAAPLGVRLVQFMNDSLTMLVLFDNEDAANTAIEQMNGVVADGHELSVSLLPETQEVLLHRLEGGTAME